MFNIITLIVVRFKPQAKARFLPENQRQIWKKNQTYTKLERIV